MGDSANGDEYNWLRAIGSEPAGDTVANATSDGAVSDEDTLRIAAPGGLPVIPRYGANDGASATNGAHARNSMAPASTPAADPNNSAVSDQPTVRFSAAPAPTPAAPSVSDLPTAYMPNSSVSSVPAPPPEQDVSDQPTQYIKATAPPALAPDVSDQPTQLFKATAPPPPAKAVAAPVAPSIIRRLPRKALVVAAGIVVGSLVGVSVILLIIALGTAIASPTGSSVYQQALTAPAAGWPDSGACRFTASGYEVGGPSACFYDGQDVRDATVSVTMTRTGGSAGISAGIAFRRTGPGAFYTFEIDGNGDWAVYKRGTVLQQGVSIAIKTDTGAKNTLQVQMKGGHFVFSINGAQVAQADDAEFASGKVGLTGYTGLKVVYTDFTITPLT